TSEAFRTLRAFLPNPGSQIPMATNLFVHTVQHVQVFLDPAIFPVEPLERLTVCFVVLFDSSSATRVAGTMFGCQLYPKADRFKRKADRRTRQRIWFVVRFVRLCHTGFREKHVAFQLTIGRQAQGLLMAAI